MSPQRTRILITLPQRAIGRFRYRVIKRQRREFSQGRAQALSTRQQLHHSSDRKLENGGRVIKALALNPRLSRPPSVYRCLIRGSPSARNATCCITPITRRTRRFTLSDMPRYSRRSRSRRRVMKRPDCYCYYYYAIVRLSSWRRS